MINHDQFQDDGGGDFSQIESLIASAGTYVLPTEDLRARVLEEARTDHAERRAQEQIWQFALAVVLLGMLFCKLRAPARELDANVPAASLSLPSDNPTWNTIDALNELRRRQAIMLRLAT